MMFNGRPTQELNIRDVEILVKERIPKGQYLDYIEIVQNWCKEDIREILRDIVALANTAGGYLIIGIREDAFCQAEAIVLIERITELEYMIRQACLDEIRRPVEGLEFRVMKNSIDQGIIVIHIPESDDRPHMVLTEKHTDFYRRDGTDNRTMSIDEISSFFLSNPFTSRSIENESLTSAKLKRISQGGVKAGPPYVKIFTENAIDRFLSKYKMCSAYPQTLVIVSPYISSFTGVQIDLEGIVAKINKDRTITYVITRAPKEQYQENAIDVLSQSPFIEIRYNEDIHAKLYICWCRKDEKESFALFGSGNFTAGGIRHNLELGMMIFSQDYGRALIRDLYHWSSSSLRTQSTRIKRASHT